MLMRLMHHVLRLICRDNICERAWASGDEPWVFITLTHVIYRDKVVENLIVHTVQGWELNHGR